MSRRRPGISAGHSSLSWTAKHLGEKQGLAAVATVPASPAPIQRIRHEAIPSPSHKCYRVIRRFVLDDVAGIEDIGTFKDATSALLLINREDGRAQALDLNGKVIGDNLRPMEKR